MEQLHAQHGSPARGSTFFLICTRPGGSPASAAMVLAQRPEGWHHSRMALHFAASSAYTTQADAQVDST